MRNIILILLLSVSVAKAQEGHLIKGGSWYSIFYNKTVEFKNAGTDNFYGEVVDGKNLVFEYMMRADEYADKTDDEHFEKIIFSVPKNATTFYFSDTALKAAFLLGCFCQERGWYQFSDGYIKGKKLTATSWKVEFDVMTKPNPNKHANAITRKFKGTFRMVKPAVQKIK